MSKVYNIIKNMYYSRCEENKCNCFLHNIGRYDEFSNVEKFIKYVEETINDDEELNLEKVKLYLKEYTISMKKNSIMSTDIDFLTKRSGRDWNVYLNSLDSKVPIILDPDAFRKKGINFNTEELSFEEYQKLANLGLNTEFFKLNDKFKTSNEWADIYDMKTKGFTAWEEVGKDYNKDKISFREFRELFLKYKY